MAMAATHELILSRLDRLDNMLRQLEEIRGLNRSPRSSGVSTPSSGTLTSEGQMISSVDLSPKSLEKHCRPMHRVMMETEMKGSLIERMDQVEERLLKFEEELEAEKRREEEEESEKKEHTKGLKRLVKKMVKGSSGRHRIKE